MVNTHSFYTPVGFKLSDCINTVQYQPKPINTTLSVSSLRSRLGNEFFKHIKGMGMPIELLIIIFLSKNLKGGLLYMTHLDD